MKRPLDPVQQKVYDNFKAEIDQLNREHERRLFWINVQTVVIQAVILTICVAFVLQPIYTYYQLKGTQSHVNEKPQTTSTR